MTGIFTGDLAKSIGWAFVRDWEKPTWGCHELPRGEHIDDGRVLTEFRVWFEDRLTWFKPDIFVAERPMEGGNLRTSAALLIGLASHARQICWQRGIRYEHVPVNSIRKHFCGSAHVGKDDVGYKCRQLGWAVGNHNAADALAILSYARDCLLEPAHQQILGGARG